MPNYMVVIRFSSVASRAMISNIVAPSTFGDVRPKGCARKPIPHPTSNALAISTMANEAQASDIFTM